MERPTIGMFWICSEVRRALFSPESSGAISGRDVTDTVSSKVADLQLDAGDRAALAEAERDVGRLPGFEALQLDLDGVGAGRNRREDEHAFGVRHRALHGSRPGRSG